MHNGTSVLLKKIMNFDRSELWRSKLNLHGYIEKKNRNRDFTLRDQKRRKIKQSSVICIIYSSLICEFQ